MLQDKQIFFFLFHLEMGQITMILLVQQYIADTREYELQCIIHSQQTKWIFLHYQVFQYCPIIQ